MSNIFEEIKSYANPAQAQILSKFFKTGPGQYGEGDIFLGIKVPIQRKLAKKYKNLGLEEIQELLNSKYHEFRLIGVLILTYKFPKASNDEKKQIYEFYIQNAKSVNNWDLVDLSAPNIVGSYLYDKNRDILYKLVKSPNLWERRIAVLATFYFIRNKDFEDCLKLCEMLLSDKHDLMHKACGWMLREIGKRDVAVLEKFLEKNILKMPRTMLRYSIEKFPEEKRKEYLKKE